MDSDVVFGLLVILALVIVLVTHPEVRQEDGRARWPTARPAGRGEG